MATTKSKDYQAIAAARIYRPADITRLPKFHIYGSHKKGKSTFCTSVGVDNIIFADPEWGTARMKTKNPHVWPIDQWDDMEDFYMFCRGGACYNLRSKAAYTWTSVDGLTRMSNMALRYVMKVAEERSLDRQPGMVDRRDYGKSGELMRQMLTNFHNLQMGVIYTSHERQIEAEDSEDDEDIDSGPSMFVPDLPKGVRGMVNSLVDVIGRIYVVNVDIKGVQKKQRRLWVGESVKYETGYRSDFTLPDMIKYPTVPKLIKLIDEGTVK